MELIVQGIPHLVQDGLFSSRRPRVRRVLGSLGRPEMAFLSFADGPDTEKEFGINRWKFVNHSPFGDKFEDSFGETSLHLSL
ncbi:hypothetical protein ACJ41O_003075 [Fusarium nematophilum]